MGQYWMVRAGEQGYLFDEFQHGFVGIGWNGLGDLSQLATQEEVRRKYDLAYENENPAKASNAVAMIWKFRSLLREGDGVITYNPTKRIYLVGTIASDYLYETDQTYHHLRRVQWHGEINRDFLTAASRNSLGSLSILFSINNDVWADIQSVLSGRSTIIEEKKPEVEKQEFVSIREDIVNNF